MPPKTDPYSNKTHRRIDVTLILITLLLIVFAFLMSAHSRASDGVDNSSASHAQSIPKR
jgi:hypothetical protein